MFRLGRDLNSGLPGYSWTHATNNWAMGWEQDTNIRNTCPVFSRQSLRSPALFNVREGVLCLVHVETLKQVIGVCIPTRLQYQTKINSLILSLDESIMGTTTGTRTWQNKRSKGQTCVFKSNFIYSLAVLCKTIITLSHQNLRGLWTQTPTAVIWVTIWNSHTLCWSWVVGPQEMVNTLSHLRISQ